MSQEFAKAGRAAGIVAEPARPPEAVEAEAVVVFVNAGGIGSGTAATVDAATQGLVSRVAAGGEFSGKRYECVPLLAPPGLKATQVLLIGLGKREQVDAGILYRAAAAAARQLAGRPRGRVAFLGEAEWSATLAEQAVAGGAVGMIGQDLYRAERRRTPFGATAWVGLAPTFVASGTAIADGVNLARRLVNTPPDDLYPES